MTAAEFSLVLEDVQRRARELKPGRVALVVVSTPFLALGWLVAHLVAAIWVLISWAIGATVTGWKYARREDLE